MKFLRLSFAIALAAAVGCAEFDTTSPTETSETTQEIKGGNAVIGNAFPGTARITINRPDDEKGNPRDPLDCSGVLIAQNLVLTSAICVYDNVDEDTGAFIGGPINVGFGNAGNEPPGGIDADDIELHRYYEDTNSGVAQLAILHLPTDAPGFATPVTPNEASLDGFSGTITIVGYGETDEGIGGGARNGIELPIAAITDEFFNAGTTEFQTCNGDGGSPVFADLGAGAGVVLIGITQFQSRCQETQARTRIDAHTEEFLIPYIDQFSGPCLVDTVCTTVGCRTPDPDCAENACEWGNACEEDCPSRDWDCPLGSFGGDECEDSGDCEQLGSCIAAVDDAAFLYCAIPCDSAVTTPQCPVNMTCESDQCVFGNPSPGSQGFTCMVGDECRSGICEDFICVNECDINANDCPGDFRCGPSKVQPGTNVCLGEDLSGGGGFCHTGSGRGPASAALLVLLAVVFVGRRRRRRD